MANWENPTTPWDRPFAGWQKTTSAHEIKRMQRHVKRLLAQSPDSLLRLDDDSNEGKAQYVDVPPDDYRAIRYAMLNVEDFLRSRANLRIIWIPLVPRFYVAGNGIIRLIIHLV
jgi:hypothetical protein